MVAKVGLGLIGLSAISVGGVALANPAWLGMSDSMPEWHPLTEDSGFSGESSAYSNDKFGKKYGKYLVGVSKAENEGWWKWAYKRWNRSDATDKNGKFKSVTPGYGTNEGGNNISLHKVCEEAYKQDTTKLKGNTDTNVGTSEFKKSEVWKYCSPGLLTHTGEDNPLYPNGKIGGNDSNKTVLVSAKGSDNDWFWKIRNEDFWTEGSDWSGKNASGESDNKSIFKTTYESDKSKAENLRKTIKKLCEEAYESDTSSQGNNNNKDAKKFCVLEASS